MKKPSAMRHVLACALLACAAVLPAHVWAADEDPQEQLAKAAATDAGAGWIFGAGVAVTNPGYIGYSRQVTPLPLVFFHYGRFFFAGIGAGYLLSNGEHYRFSLGLQPMLNRLSASDSPELAGIQTRQWSIAGGANLETFGDWGRLSFGVFHDLLGRNDGAGANVGYRLPFQAGGWTFAPGVGVRWEDSKLTNYYYGVSPAEARLPQRPAYSPGSAASPYVSLGLSTRISEHWQFRGDFTYLRFAGAIHDSPLVDRSGSPTIFIGFVYNGNRGSKD